MLKFGDHCSWIWKRMLSPFLTQSEVGRGESEGVTPKVAHGPELRRMLWNPVHSPFIETACAAPVLGLPCSDSRCPEALGSSPLCPPCSTSGLFAKSESFPVRLCFHGPSLKAAHTKSYVYKCPNSWDRQSSSLFPRTTMAPLGKWDAAGYLGTGVSVLPWPTDPPPQLLPAQDSLLPSLVWFLRP